MKNKKTCIIYCRQSSVKQDKSSVSNQEKILKEYAQKHNYEILEIITDAEKSSTGLKKLLKRLETEPINYLLVSDIDRLCRHTNEFCSTLILLIDQKIEKLISPTEEIDEAGFIPSLVWHMLDMHMSKQSKKQ